MHDCGPDQNSHNHLLCEIEVCNKNSAICCYNRQGRMAQKQFGEIPIQISVVLRS